MSSKKCVEFARPWPKTWRRDDPFPEHHLHTEGLEVGSVPQLPSCRDEHQSSAGRADRLRAAGMNPLRLAIEIGSLDQFTKGRTFVGFRAATSIDGSTNRGRSCTFRRRPPTSQRSTKPIARCSRRFSRSSSWRGAMSHFRSRATITNTRIRTKPARHGRRINGPSNTGRRARS